MSNDLILKIWNHASNNEERFQYDRIIDEIDKKDLKNWTFSMAVLLEELQNETAADEVFLHKINDVLTLVLSDSTNEELLHSQQASKFGEKFLDAIESCEEIVVDEVEYKLLNQLTTLMQKHLDEMNSRLEQLNQS